MYDTLLYGLSIANEKSTILDGLGLMGSDYSLCTIHRAENTDSIKNLKEIICAEYVAYLVIMAKNLTK